MIFLINLPFVAVCMALILAVIPRAKPRAQTGRSIDFLGGLLCALGLGGPVFALIEQPRLGWSSPGVIFPLVAGVVLFASFLAHESRTRDPMLPLRLFRRRNFSAGNIETLAMYAGLAILFFFLTIFLQQIGGYTPLQAGLATLPATVVMFMFSKRFGGLADKFGPRLFMGAGPLVAACGLLLFQRIGIHVDYVTDVLPGILVFSLGLSMTVAPLTAAVLAGVDTSQAGIASAVNNAVARVAGLLGTAAVGAAVAGSFVSGLDSNLAGRPLGPPAKAAVAEAKKLPLGRPDTAGLPRAQANAITVAADEASLKSFHLGLGIAALLVAAGGLAGAVGVRNPERAGERRGVRGRGARRRGARRRRLSRGRSGARRRGSADGLGVGAHRLDNRRESPPAHRQSVLDHRWAGGQHGSLDQPGALQVAQALGEHARRDALHGLGEFVEAQCAAEGRIDDRQLPAALQEVRRLADLQGHRLTSAGATCGHRRTP